MRRPTLLAITILLGSTRASLAQEPEKPPVRGEVRVGQPGDIDQLGLGVGVDSVQHSKSALLKIPAILDELKATDEQKDKLKAAEKQVKEGVAKRYQQIQDEKSRLKQQGDPAAEAAFRKQSLAYAGQLTRDFERPLLKVLDRNQLKRLEQIQIRADGYLAFAIADVTDRLGLTPDQETAIAECVAAGRKSARGAAWPYRQASNELARLPEDQKKVRLAGDEFQTSAAKTQSSVLEARSATLREIRKILTNAQQATFRNMVGPPFDFEPLSPIKPTKPPVARQQEAN